MSVEQALKERSNSSCELCESKENLSAFEVGPNKDVHSDNACLVCSVCLDQINDHSLIDANHWRCLNGSMWSEQTAVKVMAYRMLHALKKEDWAQDLMDQIYLEEDDLNWAKQGVTDEGDIVVQKDSNGTTLLEGDSVTIIKDLVVKGANFTAKRGTMVRNIRLTEDPKFIEGKVNGSHIVIIAEYVKKQ